MVDPPSSAQRYVALDVHKHYIMVAAVDAQQQIILAPRKLSMERFTAWSRHALSPSDAVVMEASTNVWHLVDHLEPLVNSVVVANPYQVKLIASAVVKTDKRDTLALARLLVANIVPTVWVPSLPVRELRSLIAHRRALTKQLISTKNRLQALLHRHVISPPTGDPFAAHNRTWWQTLPVNRAEKLQIGHDLQTLDQVEGRLQETDQLLSELSVSNDWFQAASLLIQMPGIAMISAMTILSAIGDISRFDSAKKLVGYAGLGARVHASGQTYRTGGLTKQGRPELRSTMITSAWRAVRYCDYWRSEFQRLAKRRGRHRAIVAIARRLLTSVWHILSKQTADRHIQPDAVERAFTKWAYLNRNARTLGLTGPQFVERALAQIH